MLRLYLIMVVDQEKEEEFKLKEYQSVAKKLDGAYQT